MTEPYVLSAFTMSTVSHGNFGLWRHPQDRTADYTDVRYWVELAKLLDDGGFDALFIADAVGQLDVFGGDASAALARAVQTPVTDPLLVVSAMAAATQRLGFGITVSTTYESPYLLARKFSTLDHLTGGRIGWNIVTSLLDSAARNIIGLDRQIPHDERYAMAQEFVEVTYKLWEGSWEPGAVLRDAERGVYTDPAKVHEIGHHGRYFTVPGAHLVEPSPQRTPVLFQAGTSPAGREFASRNAELVFVSDPRPEVLRDHIDDIRRRAAGHGRDPYSLKFVTSVEIVTDSTDSAAQAKVRELTEFHDLQAGLVLLSALSGVDWSTYGVDRPIEQFDTDASRSILAAVTDSNVRERLTLRDYVGGLGGFGGELFVGSAATVADALDAYARRTGVDGFNIAYHITPGSFADVAEYLIPELRRRGRARELGDPTTLRQRLFGGSSGLLGDGHPAASFRRNSVHSQ
ncbi:MULTISPECIES: LLM class flavin-dependent oxidoreductase [unclassified Mycolicibacterium]|uniref:LLM class flavin-dependent oxidoreductase n=1 Tax=unclassified Mycolicibacterium TaxID=2636767 RepID=UPI0012DE4E00|nr:MULTISPECIES: LLM class flavin-dependent oxidoreductase [unclassified Mycolicibacterium]MUL83625.1 LLM class flavin-dependent oxidoreductase [Mycolicibacterium sp. CBMA 329]MUL90616.1 LLM class flavin-dependent oxidoreductase [Mycolicibacterium sp. CBMA 331]MUM00586.1 LLM class flavin-dependent oxidoreductase [Mycolicibacterium sp. CBMA 334]MUM25477.1 LLM class flavin-dependent oxidoreductase [Mycolicibacterium sp. CBMA 295]MUM41560.1 LLM class flavin-dependent oxidoreductase [Mycolicibacte